MSERTEHWSSKARAAIAWKAGEPLAPVVEALAFSTVLEVTGELEGMPGSLRDELRRIGQRALLHAGAERREGEDGEEALRLAFDLARDGLRALCQKPPEPARPARVSPRDLARMLGGRCDPLEAAGIARRVRGSEEGRQALAWALRLEQPEVRIRLAAQSGSAMRDPSAGTLLSTLVDPETGAPVAEVFAFEGGALAAYSGSGAALRLEGPGLRTESMQFGYWQGRWEGGGEAIEGTLHLGERSLPFSFRRAP